MPISRRIACTAMKHLRRYIKGAQEKNTLSSILWIQEQLYGVCPARKAHVHMKIEDFGDYARVINSIAENPTGDHRELAKRVTEMLLPYIPDFEDEPGDRRYV